jgi:hypothetical protein
MSIAACVCILREVLPGTRIMLSAMQGTPPRLTLSLSGLLVGSHAAVTGRC